VFTLSRILVYTDLSPASAVALQAARRLARAEHAALQVLRVVALPLRADWTSEISAARLPELLDAVETEVREWLGGVLPEEDADGIEVAVEVGEPVAELRRYARDRDLDLVVMAGPPEDRGDEADFVRDTAASVPCSVLVVR
jgi:nucleotide-binding universal stress UspA family protein